jgi:hypothetical protein
MDNDDHTPQHRHYLLQDVTKILISVATQVTPHIWWGPSLLPDGGTSFLFTYRTFNPTYVCNALQWGYVLLVRVFRP